MNAEFETNNVGESGNTDRTGNVFPETKRKTEWKVLSELKTTRPAVQKTSAKLANIPKSISYIRSVSSWITAWEKVTYAIDNVDHAGLHQSSGCVCVCMYVFFFVPPFSFFFFFIFLLHAITIYFFLYVVRWGGKGADKMTVHNCSSVSSCSCVIDASLRKITESRSRRQTREIAHN